MKIISKKNVLRSWLWVILCSITIFLIVPGANAIQNFISTYLGKSFLIYFVFVLLATVHIFLLYLLIFKLKVSHASNYIWLFIVAGCYIYFTLKLRNTPAETAHFLEYGLLGFFLFRALSYHVRDNSIYFTATLLAMLVGTLDEIIQWIMPQRYWQFRDVWLNTLSGGLFQLVLWKVVKVKTISKKINIKSLRIFTSIFASCLIVLGLCASNTPKRVYRLTKQIPWLSFLQKEEPMSKFGYKYKDPEIGAFYSRMNPKTLQKTDKLRGKQYAQILNESVDNDYEQFLKKYNPVTDPFMHELRVHIFRRDTYFEKRKSTSNLKEKEKFYFIAYKENLILQKYFTQSINKSVYSWDKNKIKEAKILINKNKPYESPVSADLLTSFSEKTMWCTILGFISFIVFINFVLPFKKVIE